MDPRLQEVLFEVRERCVRIETMVENQAADVQELKLDVKKHGAEILRAKTSVKVLRYIIGLLLITVPAAVAAVVKIIRA